jgi:hypothetical protein
MGRAHRAAHQRLVVHTVTAIHIERRGMPGRPVTRARYLVYGPRHLGGNFTKPRLAERT